MLQSFHDACTASVRVLHELYAISDEHTDTIHPHLSSEIREHYSLGSFQANAKQSIRQRLYDCSGDGIHWLRSCIHA